MGPRRIRVIHPNVLYGDTLSYGTAFVAIQWTVIIKTPRDARVIILSDDSSQIIML
ncbi:hypothetical protein BGW36DRAFT_422246 [Talaromyces proteolyticus]|uniref:Uncharacterized protein n=1 Tax=Talaromyces proteolyticus TaxID=1131652 RepID=A0AAD4L213_9EURO|nr:uncharacterized protein BGW36DRAFT_422246 [Talaromyces proteolyticus]KAH8705704.1 hypothetical protein BGW36DRAFT_422246 [Talaromyces proteolyticus]